MEKRFVLSIVLSFFVLYIWSVLAQPNPPENSTALDTQITENKEFIEEKPVLNENIAAKSLQKSGDVVKEAVSEVMDQGNIHQLENTNLIVKLSDVGGKIKSIYIKDYQTELPIEDILEVKPYENALFKQKNSLNNKITYVYENKDVVVTKDFHISKDDYVLKADISVVDKMSNLNTIEINAMTVNGEHLDTKSADATKSRDKSLNEYVIYSQQEGIKRKAKAFKFSEKEERVVSDQVNWVGFRDRYFSALVKPVFDTSQYEISRGDEHHLNIGLFPKTAKTNNTYSFVIYSGPEIVDKLETYEYGFEKIRRYYRWGVLDAVAKFINWVMHMFYKVIPNWGVCIILTSIAIYFSMYPLTAKGMSSMKKMQALQPKMAELKEKYQNNPQKLNQEMMELYKKEKINPLGGCLPLFLQMPVFIGLYQVLWRSVAFKGADFLWIKDLSEPDRLFILPMSLPVIGNEFNVLPILMIVIMFFQQKISAKNMTLTDPAQITQQKMMMFIMPLFLGFIFYKFASGLTLYFTMFYIFSTLTQWKMSKEPKAA